VGKPQKSRFARHPAIWKRFFRVPCSVNNDRIGVALAQGKKKFALETTKADLTGLVRLELDFCK